jgi:uncharacterized membrane protein
VRCPKCGVEYPENSDRCQFCGHPKNASPEITDKEGKKRNLNELNKDQEIKKSHFSAKLLGLIGIIFFFPLAVASGFYLIAQIEKDAKYWGYAFLLVGGILWIAGVILVYTMGYDKLMATYNLTNYSYNLTDYSFKL